LDEIKINEMLNVIGVGSLDELFSDIPASIKLEKLNLPSGLSESDLLNKIKTIAKKNHTYSGSFCGAGSYFHYIPAIVDVILSRSEFYTAYTPYQAEASQGMLQAIYEYQSIIARLTEMDVVNASMYDGSTALAEAAIMASYHTKKKKIVVVEGIHPEYVDVVKTYCWGRGIDIIHTPIDKLESVVNDDIAGVLFQSPNFFGDIEDIPALTKIVRSMTKKCLIIQAMTDPTCLGKIIPPGKTDIDVFVAEGQALGLPPSFGGPGLGIFVTTKKLMRKMPGRVIGRTTEVNGDKEGFVLTLQAREQHIRREKALSNICSNQGLCMLATLIYLICLGRCGIEKVAEQNFQKAYYLKQQLSNIEGYKVLNSKPTYNEFVLQCPNVEKFTDKCKEFDIIPPLKLSKYYSDKTTQVLVCVTEQNTKDQIFTLLKAAKEAIL
jgi:glycine cleavage system P protein (glycine dehydrogenase) subunit 1